MSFLRIPIYNLSNKKHLSHIFLLNTFAFWTYTPLRHCETRQVQLGHSYSQSRIVFYEEKMHPFNKIISRDRLKDVSRIFKLLFFNLHKLAILHSETVFCLPTSSFFSLAHDAIKLSLHCDGRQGESQSENKILLSLSQREIS